MGIFKTIGKIIKGKTEEADKALKSKNAVTIGRQNIVECEKEIDEHEVRIGNFSAKIKVQKKKLAEAEEDVKKWNKIATDQAKKGNEDGARTALTEKSKYAKKVATLKSEISQNESVLNKEKTSLAALKAKVDSADDKLDNLAIRKEGAEMRKAQTGVGTGDSCFEALDDLEEQVDEAEAQAEAYEELQGVGNEAAQLEAQYEGGASDVDDELAKLMAKNKKD
jgi:phage shock protein A